MRILRIVASMDPKQGGVGAAIRLAAKGLENLGIQTEVVSCDHPNSQWVKSDPFKTHALGPGRFGYAFSWNLKVWLSQNMTKFDCAIIDGLWLWNGFASQLSFAKSKNRYFVMPHGMLDPWFQRDKSRRLKAIRNHFYWWLIERHSIKNSQGVLFTSVEEMRLARQTFVGYRPKLEKVVDLGVENPPLKTTDMSIEFAARVPALGERPYLLFLGRIHPKKGVDLLVRAYLEILKTEKLKTDFPNLVIAGPGWDSDYGRKVRGLIDEANRLISSTEHRTLKTENSAPIHVVDMLSGTEKWGALHGCSAFVLPSHQENFGIAVVEALACNKPVLISNKVNIWREIVEDGAGVAAEDSLAGTVELLRAFPQMIGNADSDRFRSCYRKRFGIDSAAQKLAGVLRESSLWA